MPPGRKRKGTKKRVGLNEELRANKSKNQDQQTASIKVERVEEEVQHSSQVDWGKSEGKKATREKGIENENFQQEKERGSTDPYDADSEHENISVADKSTTDDHQDLKQSLKEKDFKPTPLHAHFVSNIHSSDHSTPSCDSSAQETDDSCFGFDSLDKFPKKKFPFSPIVTEENYPPSPTTFSPGTTASLAESTASKPSFLQRSLQVARSPLSKVSSKDNSPQVKSILSFGISECLPIEKPTKKPKKKPGSKKKKEDNAWAREWTVLFKDVEKHDLVIE